MTVNDEGLKGRDPNEMIEITVESAGHFYNEELLKLIAENNPRTSRFENGRLYIKKKEFTLLESGIAAALKEAKSKPPEKPQA